MQLGLGLTQVQLQALDPNHKVPSTVQEEVNNPVLLDTVLEVLQQVNMEDNLVLKGNRKINQRNKMKIRTMEIMDQELKNNPEIKSMLFYKKPGDSLLVHMKSYPEDNQMVHKQNYPEDSLMAHIQNYPEDNQMFHMQANIKESMLDILEMHMEDRLGLITKVLM